MTNRNKFRLWTRALASTAFVGVAAVASAPAQAACVSVLGVTIQTDLLGNTCINGGQTGPASTNGTAIGAGATVLSADGIAIGVGAQSTSDGAIVLGDGSSVTGIDGLAIGAGANVLGDRGVGLGLGALVGGIDGVAIGNGARSDGFRGIAVGANALSLLEADLAIGRFARAGAPGDPFGSNTAFGDGAVASGGFASAFGANSSAVGLNTVAIGAASNASAPGSVALGAGATATTPDSVAIGRNAVAADADLTAGVVAPATTGPVRGVAFDNTTGVNAGAVSVGATGDARQVRNVADGSAATDAVNVRQLSDVVAQTNGALNALDGRVTANTTAIAGLDARTTANEGAIAGLDGRVTTNTTAITNLDARTTANTTAIANIDGRTTVNEGAITNLQTQIASGTVGLVRQDQTTRAITVGATTDGTDVSVAGTGGTRTISGVSAGAAPDQATNAAQLATVISTFGPGATLNADGSVTIPAYAVQGTSQTTVGGAIGALDSGLTGVRNQVAAINRSADGVYLDVNTTRPAASATGTESVAMGGGATATANGSVAIGSGSVADRGPRTGYSAPGLTTAQNSVGSVSVGSTGAERQITNVAAGTAATDAVNVAQLQGGLTTTVRYDSLPSGGTNYGSVTLGNGSGPVALRNIAPGTVGTDAVNLDQLRSVSFDLRNDMRGYRTDAQRGTAVALAATGMRYDDRPGRTSIGGAVSVFRGETGVAMGIGHTSSDQRLRYNAAVSFSPNGGSNVGAVAGATFSFGGD